MSRKPKPNRKKTRRTPPATTSQANQAQTSQTNHQVAAQFQQFRGPLPPPEQLQRYNQVLEGAAERIIRMAEKEQDHLISIDNQTVSVFAEERKRGQRYGLIVAGMALLTSAAALYLGMQTAASVIGGTTVVGLVTVFVAGRPKNET